MLYLGQNEDQIINNVCCALDQIFPILSQWDFLVLKEKSLYQSIRQLASEIVHTPKDHDQFLTDCPILSPPQNGKISTGLLSQGTVVNFSCNAGYNLFGDNQLTCQSNSTWDLPDPVCKQGKVYREYHVSVF